MDFPITRADLRALGSKSDEELFKEQIEEKIQKTMETIVSKVIEHAKFGHSYYKHPANLIVNFIKQSTRGIFTADPQLQRSILPDILEMLQIKFPECDILVDPLKTYIYIGWT
jgi:hypothetical protein